MRELLALLSTLIFAGGFFAPMIDPQLKPNEDFRGAIIIQWGLVMGYYFGTSKSSGAKDATIASLVEKR